MPIMIKLNRIIQVADHETSKYEANGYKRFTPATDEQFTPATDEQFVFDDDKSKIKTNKKQLQDGSDTTL